MVYQHVEKRRSPASYVDDLPAMRPIKTTRPGTSSNSATPRHFNSVPKHKRRRLLLLCQLLVVAATGCLVFMQVDTNFRTTLESETDSVGPRKRQLISSGDDANGVRNLARPLRLTPDLDPQQHTERLEALTEALLSQTEPAREISLFPEESATSEVYAHPTTGPSGQKVSYFYRFTNVKIGDDGNIEFFGGTEAKTPEAAIFDVVDLDKDAAAQPKAPTTIILNGGKKTNTIDVRYMPQTRPESACTDWIEAPAMLLHGRQPADMWHSWTNGLLPTFQTLRELGYISLMEVNYEGGVREVTEGVQTGECPKVADLSTGAVFPSVDCTQRRGLAGLLQDTCTEVDTWCIPGVWPASMAVDLQKPVLLHASDDVLDTPWGSLYTAMGGSSVRAWNGLKGTCLRNVIIGTTRTLNMAERIPGGGEGGAPATQHEARAAALDVFAKFAATVHLRLEANNAVEFKSYGDWNADRMRRGIKKGLSTVSYIDGGFQLPAVMQPGGGASEALAEDWQELQSQSFLFSPERVGLTDVEDEEDVRDEASELVRASPLGPPEALQRETPRPVVTYITRFNDLKAAMLNERQILRYLVWRFNVTVHVTSLTEHVGAAAALLAKTDVLIGAHGDEWTHAMFLKPGSASLRLLPYGWRRPDGSLLRGNNVTTLVHLRRGTHLDWVNPHAEYSFFRREDFEDDDPDSFRPHPTSPTLGGAWAAPDLLHTHPAWLNANTYADLYHLGPYIDEIMFQAGIVKQRPPSYIVLQESAAVDDEGVPLRRGGGGSNAAAAGWEQDDDDAFVVETEEEDFLEDSAGDDNDEDDDMEDVDVSSLRNDYSQELQQQDDDDYEDDA